MYIHVYIFNIWILRLISMSSHLANLLLIKGQSWVLMFLSVKVTLGQDTSESMLVLAGLESMATKPRVKCLHATLVNQYINSILIF